MPFLPINDYRLHFEIVDNILPTDTLFIHGNLASTRWWHPTRDIWQKRAATSAERMPGKMVMVDWRGFGKSDAPRALEDIALPRLASDLIAVAHRLGMSTDANIVGHSCGGLLTLQVLSQQPDRFGRALLLNPVGVRGLKLRPDFEEVYDKMQVNRDFLATIILGTIYKQNLSVEMAEGIVDDAFNASRMVWKGVPKHTAHNIDISEAVRQIPNETLVLHGDQDMVLPIEDSREVAELLPNGRFHEMKEQGHCCNLENPELFVRLADQFFSAGLSADLPE